RQYQDQSDEVGKKRRRRKRRARARRKLREQESRKSRKKERDGSSDEKEKPEKEKVLSFANDLPLVEYHYFPNMEYQFPIFLIQQQPFFAIRAPKDGGMKATADPNYQTLAGLNNDEVFQPKGGGGAGAGGKLIIRPPAAEEERAVLELLVVVVVTTSRRSVRWQHLIRIIKTLAGLNNEDVFKPKVVHQLHCFVLKRMLSSDGGGGGRGGGANLNIRAPTDARGKKVATFDPNYQTLAGLE
ncbi:hypothetical protein OSTOST_18644, partial [Ostertagia ostertagi]